MPKKKTLLNLLISAAALFALSGCMSNSILNVAERRVVEFPELVDGIKGYRLIFVGEMHDKKWTHTAQLKVISALKEAGVNVSIGVEMFRKESQKDLDGWVAGTMSEEEFGAVYRKNWGLPWRQYREIFLYARDKKVPVVALNISRKIIHQVFTKGFHALGPEDLKELGDIECSVDKPYEEFIREAMEEHDLKDASFQNFCEAQMVWDSTMARNSVEYLKDNNGATLVVLAGSGHSWKRGIPAQVGKRSDIKFVVIIPEAEDKPSRENVTAMDADYLWLRW
ncbi:MAG: ChaN family lipoprotein [Deltaproteobacteria bacterium]|nr:ChaN family lipoprotein [Deltaproteobacteria bacterium]